MQDFLFLFDQF
uniref:Uncharacterized protein n=1 Tax=Romanomermis culicivorax TaxID=13658 RepID=A0A915HHI0_ROMCU